MEGDGGGGMWIESYGETKMVMGCLTVRIKPKVHQGRTKRESMEWGVNFVGKGKECYRTEGFN